MVVVVKTVGKEAIKARTIDAPMAKVSNYKTSKFNTCIWSRNDYVRNK